MSEFGTRPLPAARTRRDEAEAAIRAVLWRIDHRGADPRDIRWALEALGLIQPAPPPATPASKKPRSARAQDPVTKRWLPAAEETP